MPTYPTTATWRMQDALLALLKAEKTTQGSPLYGWTVELGKPAQTRHKTVWIDGATDEEHATPISGGLSKDTDLDLKVFLYVDAETDLFEKVRAYLMEPVNRVLTLVAQNVGVDGASGFFRSTGVSVQEGITKDSPITRAALAEIRLKASCYVVS